MGDSSLGSVALCAALPVAAAPAPGRGQLSPAVLPATLPADSAQAVIGSLGREHDEDGAATESTLNFDVIT